VRNMIAPGDAWKAWFPVIGENTSAIAKMEEDAATNFMVLLRGWEKNIGVYYLIEVMYWYWY
jgi:hypothetical protein